MKHGYFRLEHTYFSRGGNKYHGPSGAFHLSSVQNYDANWNKAEHVISVNLPDDRYDIYRELIAHSNKITRKNGRMAERFILSHDNQMSKAHRIEATKAFAHKVTLGGELKAYAYHHAQDTHNPHAHILVLDVGKDGKPHGHFGRNASYRREHSPIKGNVTEWCRIQWEDAQNEVLERYGYDFRMDRRSNLERGLEPPQRHEGPLRHDTYIEQPEPEVPTPEPEAPMPDLAEVRPEDYIRGALELDRNIQWLQATEKRIESLTQEAKEAQESAEGYKQAAVQQDKQADAHGRMADHAHDSLKPLLREDGSYKGFRLKVWKWEYQSPKYREAAHYEGELQYQQYLQKESREWADQHLKTAQQQADRATSLIDKAEATKRDLDKMIEVYGGRETLIESVGIMHEGIEQNLSHTDPQEVVALHEIGELTAEEATRALELMGQEAHIVRVELRDRQEREQEGLEQ